MSATKKSDMPTKRPKLPKPAAPVRAWIPFHKRGTFESEVRDAIYAGSFHEKRQKFGNPDYTCRSVGLYDPRTHRAVPRKKAKKPVVRRKRNG